MNIVVICPHPEACAPGQRLKYEQYFSSWRAAGFTVDVRPFWDTAAWRVLYERGHHAEKVAGLLRGALRRVKDLGAAKRADLVYLFLEAAPLGAPYFERALKAAGVPIIYDIDDLVYLPHAAANPIMLRLRNHEKIPELMTMADAVIVCTSHLLKVALERNANVTNISSTIDTDTYLPRPHRERTRHVVVGWSGSFSTSPYLHLLDDVLRRLQETEDIEVKVIGDASFASKGLRLSAQRWQLASEVADLSEIDIGVYPLPDAPWVYGKSGLKALQYMGLGIPTVAQRIGSNLEIIKHGVDGYLVQDEWEETLRALIRDPALRKRIGDAGRRVVVERYSVKANAPTYLDILRRAVRR